MTAYPESGRSDRQKLGEIRVRFRPRLCKNSTNFLADGTALHIDCKRASDEILISHLDIGKAGERLQFTTSSFHFAFLHSLFRELPFPVILPEGPLPGAKRPFYQPGIKILKDRCRPRADYKVHFIRVAVTDSSAYNESSNPLSWSTDSSSCRTLLVRSNIPRC